MKIYLIGAYTITYTIVDRLNPTNTSSAKVMLIVEYAEVLALIDSFGTLNSADGATTKSVLKSDLLDGNELLIAEGNLMPWIVKDTGRNVMTEI